jgi:putative spermidine/putrescine transport system substrate-binding protein
VTSSGSSRREFLTRMSLMAGGVVGGASLLAACGSSGGSSGSTGGSAAPKDVSAKWPKITSRQVVVAGFGGETYDLRDREEFTPYAKLSGARVVQAAWDYGKFVSMAKSANPAWDMIDFDGYSIAALIGSYAYSVVMGWSTKLSSTPTSWADFFNTKKFPGKRAFPKSIYAGTAEIALLADGVAKDKIYPLDLDRAFAKLDTIKDDLLFYDSYAQGQQYMSQGSASMIATANSRMIQLKNDGQPVDWTYQDAVLYPWGGFAMPQHAPHADAANALIDYLSTPEAQALVAKKLYLGPTVSAAFDSLTKQELALQPSAPANVAKQLSVDVSAAAKQDPAYVKKFFAWVAA